MQVTGFIDGANRASSPLHREPPRGADGLDSFRPQAQRGWELPTSEPPLP